MLHPILTTTFEYSPEQIAVLEAEEREILVAAGAGTGKTRTLVARYLALLAQGIPLRSVVAITFTRKAAREMRNRVRQQIKLYLDSPDLPADEYRHWQQVYGELDGARIGTIHSLCTEILRTHPAEADVDPRFELLDEGVSAILRQQAAEQALVWAANKETMLPLFSRLGEWSLQDALNRLLLKRLETSEAFDVVSDSLLKRWEEVIRRQQRQCLEAVEADPVWCQAVGVLRDNQATVPDDKIELWRQSIVAMVDTPVNNLPDRLANLSQLDQINLAGGRTSAWKGGKAQLNAVKEALKTVRSRWRAESHLLQLVLTPLDGQLATLLPLLNQLFSNAEQQYRRLKVDRSALDFDDLEVETLNLLANFQEVRDYWRENIKAVLVDEFQDTNRRQSTLISQLRTEDTQLFLVGDAKQSIYRFRGADVSVFRRKQRKAEQVRSLTTSYRAHKQLIDDLNILFQPILDESPTTILDQAKTFSPLQPWRTGPGKQQSSPFIELHLAAGAKRDGALDRAATALALRLQELVSSSSLTVDDIAILCRSSSSFTAYENALERAQLPFVTVAGRGFYQRPEIRDVLNALQAVTDPSDDLALAGLLRSPVIGISDGGLYWLADHRADGRPSLWSSLMDLPESLSPEDRSRAALAVELIDNLRQIAGRITIADLLKEFLDATKYRAALIRAGQHRAARNVSKLLIDAHASGLVNASEFLEYIAVLRDTGTREGEARAIETGVIKIMSVHAAKGLEFPLVVIGDIAYQGRGYGGPVINPELGPVLSIKDEDGNSPAIYHLGQWLESTQEQAESRRLLYVAATRAQDKLIVSGTVSVQRNGRLSRLGDWLGLLVSSLNMGDLDTDFDPDGNRAIRLEMARGQATIYEPRWTSQEAVARPDIRSTRNSIPDSSMLAALDDDQRSDEASPPSRVWQVVPTAERPIAPAWVVGSLVHEALAQWRFPDLGFETWATHRALNCGLMDPRQLANAANRSARLLARFKSSSLYRLMIDADQRLHEVPYYLEINQEAVSGYIDSLCRHDDQWTIIEFKTDEIEGDTTFDHLVRQDKYLHQLQQYETAVGHLLGVKPNVVLCMLDYDSQVRSFSLAQLLQQDKKSL